MPAILLYATRRDADDIRKWINAEPDVAWLVKVSEDSNTYYWKAVEALERIEEQEYALWHRKSGPLNIPSGNPRVRDAIVVNPFQGWKQNLDRPGVTTPWFGGNVPGPYLFAFAEAGREAPGNLARSAFSWFGDYYRPIGKAARPEARRWWQRLRRFVSRSSIQVPWPVGTDLATRRYAHIFPDAMLQTRQGRRCDVNP